MVEPNPADLRLPTKDQRIPSIRLDATLQQAKRVNGDSLLAEKLESRHGEAKDEYGCKTRFDHRATQ